MPYPSKEIDPKKVELLASFGLTQREIAQVLGTSDRLLRRRFRQALEVGKAKLRNSLRRKQIEMAMRGSVPMLIWLGRQYLGQGDKREITKAEKVVVVEEVVFPRDGDVESTKAKVKMQ